MRTRSAALLACAATCVAACANNPDPRPRTPEDVLTDTHGAWIVVHMHDGTAAEGELIDVQPTFVRVLTGAGVVRESRPAIATASLYTYQPELSSFVAWGVLGTLSTIANGVFLVFTAPAWELTAGLSSLAERSHVKMQYPDDTLEALGQWARFPGGMPPTVHLERVPPPLGTAPPGDTPPIGPSSERSPAAPSSEPSLAPSAPPSSGSGSAPSAPASAPSWPSSP
jgi:hypothetical protein